MDTDHAAESPRIEYASVFPSGARAMVGLQRAIDGAGLEPLLLELVKMRASQINGCLTPPPNRSVNHAYCTT